MFFRLVMIKEGKDLQILLDKEAVTLQLSQSDLYIRLQQIHLPVIHPTYFHLFIQVYDYQFY